MSSAPKDKPNSPFAAALNVKPQANARDAERLMDSPHRGEVEAAQTEKQAGRAEARESSDAVIKGNVRSPIGP